jgi:hypothetical protein
MRLLTIRPSVCEFAGWSCFRVFFTCFWLCSRVDDSWESVSKTPVVFEWLRQLVVRQDWGWYSGGLAGLAGWLGAGRGWPGCFVPGQPPDRISEASQSVCEVVWIRASVLSRCSSDCSGRKKGSGGRSKQNLSGGSKVVPPDKTPSAKWTDHLVSVQQRGSTRRFFFAFFYPPGQLQCCEVQSGLQAACYWSPASLFGSVSVVRTHGSL